MLTRPPLPGSNFFGLGIDVRSGLAQATLFPGALLPLTAPCRWRRARVYRAPPPQAPPPGRVGPPRGPGLSGPGPSHAVHRRAPAGARVPYGADTLFIGMLPEVPQRHPVTPSPA